MNRIFNTLVVDSFHGGFLAFAIAIHVGRVDERNTGINGFVKNTVGILVTEGITPFATTYQVPKLISETVKPVLPSVR